MSDDEQDYGPALPPGFTPDVLVAQPKGTQIIHQNYKFNLHKFPLKFDVLPCLLYIYILHFVFHFNISECFQV